MAAHVAVSIVGFRNVPDIVRCLRAVGASTYADYEVIICENGGEAAHAALVAALPSALPGGQPVRVVLAPGNLGYAGGVNTCLAETPDVDAWWVLNPDTEPYPDAMAALVERLSRGDCEAAGGVLLTPEGTVQSIGGVWRKWMARAVSIGNGQPAAGPFDQAMVEARQQYLSGASMMVGRAFVGRVGPLRHDYFLYCEEVEWCLRGLARGIRLGFAPGARVLHHHGTTTGAGEGARARPRLPVYLDERNRILLSRDCFGAALPVIALGSLVSMLARFGRRRAWRQLGYALDGWWAGC